MTLFEWPLWAQILFGYVVIQRLAELAYANANTRRFYEAAGFRVDGARQPVDFGEASLPEIRYQLG